MLFPELFLPKTKLIIGANATSLSSLKDDWGQAFDSKLQDAKSAIGHLLGAAGAVEAVFCIKAMNNGVCPPTLNLDNPSEGCDIDLVPHVAKERKIRNIMSNSFGFGGTNASLIISPVS